MNRGMEIAGDEPRQASWPGRSGSRHGFGGVRGKARDLEASISDGPEQGWREDFVGMANDEFRISNG
jgi:hypothetical protein